MELVRQGARHPKLQNKQSEGPQATLTRTWFPHTRVAREAEVFTHAVPPIPK